MLSFDFSKFGFSVDPRAIAIRIRPLIERVFSEGYVNG